MGTIAKPLPGFLKLLAHDLRWQLLTILAKSDRRVQELVSILQRPQNLVSYHLRLLRDGDMVKERRSSADGRDIYYSLDLDHLRALYLNSGQALHPALACIDPQKTAAFEMNQPHWVLFLCTHNSARSQLAEGILRATADSNINAASAGSQPGRVHPMAIRAAQTLGIDISQQRSKHMDEFSGQAFDTVITVCDQVREICPVFPDDPYQIHWSIPDPASVTGSEEEQLQAFIKTAHELEIRISYLRPRLEVH